MIEGVLLAAFVFTLFLAVHFLHFHYWHPYERWKAVSRTAKFFFVLYTLTFWLLPFPNWLGLLDATNASAKFFAYANGALVYIFLFLSYGQFYFLVDRGVSARILIEIVQSPDRELSRAAISSRYVVEHLQGRRIEDMIYGKYLVEESGRYRLTRKGVLFARMFLFCKKYLHFYPGG